jgi:DNA (cytosine-5)-methyltransferase 1
MDKISDYLTMTQAAEFLGVRVQTLNMWLRTGRIKSYQHPMANYRLYSKEDLEDILRTLKESRS